MSVKEELKSYIRLCNEIWGSSEKRYVVASSAFYVGRKKAKVKWLCGFR